MKLTVTLTLAVMATAMASSAVLADEHHSDYQDLDALKQLHVAFHEAVSHAGVDAATKGAHLIEVLDLWTDDGVLIAGGATYEGKGTPGTTSCALGR